MPLPSPTKFAELLKKSLLPEEVKQLILKKLSSLSNDQIVEIYQLLQQEQIKTNKIKAELDSKIHLEMVKFEHELENISKQSKN